MKELRAFVAIAIFSISIIISGSLLVPYTYGITECEAIITSVPRGANVYIDGELKGQTPYEHFVGSPFEADIRVEMEGFETWEEHIIVGVREHKLVEAILTPLQAGNGESEAVTKTVTSTVTTTSSTTITTTATTTIAADTITTTTTITTTSPTTITSTTTATTTISANTVTVTSEITTATTSTITSNVTEQTGLPATFTYGAIGVAVIAVVAAVIISTRKSS